MSVDDELDSIIGEQKPSRGVTKYRRRDLRNGLASRIGVRDTPRRDLDPGSKSWYDDDRGEQPQEAPKQRLRILNIPLDASDFTIEDMVKEIAEPVYSNIYDHESGRTAVFEFEAPEKTDEAVRVLNGKEINGVNVVAEIFESRSRQSRRSQKKGNRGGRRGPRGPKREKPAQPTADQLDQELEHYMNS
ncbi:LAQU0S17e02058g1_1 [Lachancea quebecensis]|uniref:LAQU0S17e02058g1_1 n=1 Tax=Lachancea quebecensis TaxID=1654605 RepID=A0A0P1KWB8_9SACH|nr:LAQU0S17e02058g1_1 [Lachancea quebecensis]